MLARICRPECDYGVVSLASGPYLAGRKIPLIPDLLLPIQQIYSGPILYSFAVPIKDF